MDPTTAELREYALLPATAAEATLAEHVRGAGRTVRRLTGLAEAPAAAAEEWRELCLVLATRAAWPFLYPVDDGYAQRDRVWASRQLELLMAIGQAAAVEAGETDAGLPWMAALGEVAA